MKSERSPRSAETIRRAKCLLAIALFFLVSHLEPHSNRVYHFNSISGRDGIVPYTPSFPDVSRDWEYKLSEAVIDTTSTYLNQSFHDSERKVKSPLTQEKIKLWLKISWDQLQALGLTRGGFYIPRIIFPPRLSAKDDRSGTVFCSRKDFLFLHSKYLNPNLDYGGNIEALFTVVHESVHLYEQNCEHEINEKINNNNETVAQLLTLEILAREYARLKDLSPENAKLMRDAFFFGLRDISLRTRKYSQQQLILTADEKRSLKMYGDEPFKALYVTLTDNVHKYCLDSNSLPFNNFSCLSLRAASRLAHSSRN